MSVKIGSLFSGIGGLELGLERSGLGEVVWQCEINEYCREILARHWPEAKRFGDVREVNRGNAEPVDIICGGFPCQPVSLAGKRLAQDDPRWLWPEFARVVREIEPAIVIVENVPGLRSAGLLDVLRGLAALGFDAEWTCIAARDVGAPHLRRRIFIVASHPERIELRSEPGWLGRACRTATALALDDGEARLLAHAHSIGKLQPGGEVDSFGRWARDGSGEGRDVADSHALGWDRGPGTLGAGERESPDRGEPIGLGWWAAEPPVGRVAHGVSRRMDRTKALGNAVVTYVAQAIGYAIQIGVRE